MNVTINHPRQARYHLPVGLSLLFRPVPKARTRPRLNVEHQMGGGKVLRFSAREALGVPEQTLLLVILELAGEQLADVGHSVVLGEADGRPLPNRLWAGLYPEGGVGLQATVMVDTTWDELNRRCGSGNGGSAIRTRKECMRRLCEVVVWEELNQRRASHQSFLVVWLVGDDQRIHLALNYRLASVFFGAQFAKVSLQERMRLCGDLPMLIHAFFSTCIRPGHKLKIGSATLAQRVWRIDEPVARADTLRRRQRDLARAMAAVGRLPKWKVEFEKDRDLWTIYRSDGPGIREMPSGLNRKQATALPAQPELEKSCNDNGLSRYDVSGLFNR